jgi:hypothetical protein
MKGGRLAAMVSYVDYLICCQRMFLIPNARLLVCLCNVCFRSWGNLIC